MDVPSLVVAVAGPIVGVIVGYVFYRRGQRRKEPCRAIRSNNIVAGYTAMLGALDILYGGERVEDLTISRVLFWNRGRAVIDRQDVAPGDPLKIIAAGDVKLLDLRVLQVNSGPSQFSATLAADQKSASLDFEFLDPGKGAVLQVVHSGTSSEDIQVIGSIKGVGNPAKKRIRIVRSLPLPTPAAFDRRLRPITRRRLRTAISLFAGLAMVVAALLVGFLTPEGFNGTAWVLLGYGVAVIILAAVEYFSTTRAPRGLDAFEEEM